MTRGEVWWTDIPGVGRRPTLILTRDTAIPLLNALTVAICTGTQWGIPTEVELGEDDGLPLRSVVSLDNLVTISKRRLKQRIVELSSERMAEVCQALRFATAC